jgi:hypothetical protein
MRRFRIVGLCLVAAFALCAVVAGAAAAASPEYWTDKKSNPHTFEPNKEKIAFTSSGTASSLKGGVVIECATDTSKGDILNATESAKVKVEYHGCEAPSITSSCQKSPSKPGVIKTEALKAHLVLASEKSGGTLVPVNSFEPEKATKPFAKFTCGPHKELNVIVTGHIFAEQKPVNAGLSTTGETINAEKSKEEGFGCSKQQYLFLNGTGSCMHLETGAGVSWNTSHDTITLKKAVELKY